MTSGTAWQMLGHFNSAKTLKASNNEVTISSWFVRYYDHQNQPKKYQDLATIVETPSRISSQIRKRFARGLDLTTRLDEKGKNNSRCLVSRSVFTSLGWHKSHALFDSSSMIMVYQLIKHAIQTNNELFW